FGHRLPVEIVKVAKPDRTRVAFGRFNAFAESDAAPFAEAGVEDFLHLRFGHRWTAGVAELDDLGERVEVGTSAREQALQCAHGGNDLVRLGRGQQPDELAELGGDTGEVVGHLARVRCLRLQGRPSAQGLRALFTLTWWSDGVLNSQQPTYRR